MALLQAIPFESDRDDLWFAGDLINRGPKSLDTVRFVKSLDDQAVTVLGNHDLHLLAIYYGGHRVLKKDTFQDMLEAEDCQELLEWLRHLPFLIESDDVVMTHAGIPHIWSLEQARSLAQEVENVVRGGDYRHFFQHMYGNEPDKWDNALEGMDRIRSITNYLTRMRYVAEDGTLDFQYKGPVTDKPEGFEPWFEFDTQVEKPLYFGHWASLEGVTGKDHLLATDTGCVWGRGLTAIRTSDRKRFMWLQDQLIESS